jgi:hypothetical protein
MPVSTTYAIEYKYTVSGLIEELENIRGEHGEIPVAIFDALYGVVSMSSIYVSDGDGEYVLEKRVVIG